MAHQEPDLIQFAAREVAVIVIPSSHSGLVIALQPNLVQCATLRAIDDGRCSW
jgi:hypothetical protein